MEIKNKVDDAVTRLAQADYSLPEGLEMYNLAMGLQASLNRPVKVVIGGEFSSGKSTFTEMLLGKHVVQMQAAASTLPTVHFQYAQHPAILAISSDSTRTISDINSISEEELRELDCLKVMANLPFLKQFELFDTPGTSDPTRDVDQLITVAEQADFIIWCTNATQAWRASEKRMWEEMPSIVKEKSILLVTHIDLPNGKPSVDRLMKRLQKEASSDFKEIVPISLLDANAAHDSNASITDMALWKSSGGANCITVMKGIFSEIHDTITDHVEKELLIKVIPYIDQHVSGVRPCVNYWSRRLDITKKHIQGADAIDVSAAYATLLDAMLKFIDGNFQLIPTEAEIFISRINEAQAFINDALEQEYKTTFPEEAHAVIKQLDWEFNHMRILD